MMTPTQAGILEGRLGLLSKAILFVWIAIVVRFFLVAIVSHQQFVEAASRQHVGSKVIVPQRGEIFAHKEERLATNIVKYAVLIVPKNIKEKEKVAGILAPELNMSQAEIFDLINNDKPYIPPIKKGLTQEEAERIVKLNLVGVSAIPESYRFYPEGRLAAHLLGFVNAEGRGQYGLEGFYDDLLRGFKGSVRFEKDERGRAISWQESISPARDGTALVLTLDRNLQFIVEERLREAIEKFKADSGSIIVISAQDGQILAMASEPGFDPNYYKDAGQATQLFLNPATQLIWEPGSVIKPLVMAAALNEGLVAPETTETFGNSVVVDGWTINTAQNKAFGKETMTQVLENSDNVAMVWLADKLGNENLFRYFQQFGFDEKTNIDLQGETDTQILALQKWRNINRATMSFGQGIAITPLQLVSAYAALGNGGKLYRPHLVKSFVHSDGKKKIVEPQLLREIISEETSRKISAMLVSVVERGHGKRARIPGYKVAGKTGTAQVPSSAGGYEEDKHIGSFCGFAPAERPVFAMCVKLDTPKNVDWAEASAAPVFGQIAAWILANYGIPPTE